MNETIKATNTEIQNRVARINQLLRYKMTIIYHGEGLLSFVLVEPEEIRDISGKMVKRDALVWLKGFEAAMQGEATND